MSLLRGALAAALLLVAGPALAEGVDETASQLLERAFSNLYADDYIQTLELSTRGEGMRPLTRKLQITRKQSVRPGKALVRFLEPFDIRRTSVLILENDRAADDLYVYLPALDLTRRVSAAQRADSFFGTDLSYEDIEPKRAADYEVSRIVADGDAEGCVRLELRAAESFESTYERMVSCIETERAIIRWSEFFRHGRPVKRLEIDRAAVEPIGSRFIPFLMTIRTLRTGSETQVRTLAYELTAEISDRLFSTWNLAAGDADRDRSRVEPLKATE